MTGVQALEHKYPDKLPFPGQCAKMEFEYIRHGTTSLIGFFDVATGRMEMPYLNSTRTEDDFVEAVKALTGTDPQAPWTFICNVVSYVPNFRYKAADRHHSDPLDNQQVVYIWDLFQFFFYISEQSLLSCCIYIHVIQQVLQFHPGGFRRFLASNAMLRGRYQGLWPVTRQ